MAWFCPPKPQNTIYIHVSRIRLHFVVIVVCIHFALTTWATLTAFLPTSYVFSNFLLFVVGLWAIADSQRTDPSVMFLLAMIFTIISDIVAISIYYESPSANNKYASTYRFSAGMAILNLILKPLFCICIFLDFRNRGGEVDTRWAENPYITIEGQNSGEKAGASQP